MGLTKGKVVNNKDTNYCYWDLGAVDILTPSQKNLASVLNALILCDGKLHDVYSGEARDGQWSYNTRSCSVLFRISLPANTKDRFEELSGHKLSEPPQISIN